MEGKNGFYPKVKHTLISAGFQVHGEGEIKGKGRSHASKPDYVAVKDGALVIGEIKSPLESPSSGSWRQPQHSDTLEFTRVRLEVADREKNGLLSKEVGGHEIIIRGQVPDYVRKLGVTFDLPGDLRPIGRILGGYSAPAAEAANIALALKNCRKRALEKIEGNNDTVTFIFDPA